MPEIKCIIFDWGGVLIENPVEDFANECAKVLGTDVEKLQSAYAEFAHQFERGLISEQNLWQKISKTLNINIQSENSIWYDCFKKIYSPRQDIFNLARDLKDDEYTVALLSNTEIPAMNFFNDQNYDMFEYKVFSCQEGTAKPESELYQILLEKISLPPEQMLFIDDKPENIETASRLNLNTIHFTTKDNLFENLLKFKIIL